MIQSKTKTSAKLLMGNSAPALEIKTLDERTWNLADKTPENYTMVVFYRGLHCPVCEQYLTELAKKLDAFTQLGVSIIAISGDPLDKAKQFREKTNLQPDKIGYGLTRDDMRRWGLYTSQGHFDSEPDLFSEPAVFLIKPDGQLYFANIGTHPFSRVGFDFLLEGLEYVIPKDYPFRGTVSA